MTEKPKNTFPAIYRMIWRWHFYAGIFCIPFVIVLAFTGSIYLFKPYYEHWQERDYRELVDTSERYSPNQHIEAALAAVPKSKLLSYRLSQAMSDAVLIKVQAEQTWWVYVHPYTLEILKRQPQDQMLMQWIKTLHGELLLGNFGSVLVELAACWAIVLIVSGLYLWWPRSARGLAGILYPRLRQRGRIFWRDLHSVTGIWISAFALFLLITGLPWALVWGASLKQVRAYSETPVQSVTPIQNATQLQSTTAVQGKKPAQQDWSQGRQDEHDHHRKEATSRFDLSSAIVQSASQLKLAAPVELSPVNEVLGQWKVSSQSQNRTLREDVWINSSGEVERRSGFAERKLLDRIIGVGISAHEGQLFGWFNLALGLLTCAALIFISITGFVLWRQRKPALLLGAPPALPARWNAWLVALILVLAVLLPVMGLSLMLLLLLEWSLLKRLSVTREWLGLST